MKILFVLSVLFASPAHAALPPGAESLRRLTAVASSPEVLAKIGSTGWADSIVHQGDGAYLVRSRNCALPVKVEALPMGHPGPGSLRVTAGQLVCQRP